MAGEIIGYGGSSMTGGVLAYSTTVNGSYTVIAGVLDLTPEKLQVTKVKRTAYDSPSYAMVMAPGMIDPGEIEFKGLMLKALTATLYAITVARTNYFWRIQLHDSDSTPSNWKCEGFICEFGTPMPIDDNVIIDVKICCTGLPIFAAGA